MFDSHLLLLSCGCSNCALNKIGEAEYIYFISIKCPADKVQVVVLMYKICIKINNHLYVQKLTV